jgi:hypothetical protein
MIYFAQGNKEGQIFEHSSKLQRRMTICQKKCWMSNALDGSVDVTVWENDVEDKDDSDWVENT